MFGLKKSLHMNSINASFPVFQQDGTPPRFYLPTREYLDSTVIRPHATDFFSVYDENWNNLEKHLTFLLLLTFDLDGSGFLLHTILLIFERDTLMSNHRSQFSVKSHLSLVPVQQPLTNLQTLLLMLIIHFLGTDGVEMMLRTSSSSIDT